MALLPEKRLNNYAKTGRIWLTPAQERRYVKKWRKMFQAKDDDDYDSEKWKRDLFFWDGIE